MHTDIRAVIISEDFVSSAVLARTLKEWWCADVSCDTYASVDAALKASDLDCADVVFISELADEMALYDAVREIHARAAGPMCVVVTSRRRESALAAALRAGAHDCINRYVASEDDIHRCLWGILRERAAAHLRLLTPAARAAATA